jgi:hypothetical protein
MFEHKSKPLLSRATFARRLLFSTTAGLAIIALSLGVGMWGYHHFEDMSWLDAFVNAAMILSGMGPLAPLATEAGKLFAGFYAIYSGLAVILIAGIIFAPVVHRALHRFHLDAGDTK